MKLYAFAKRNAKEILRDKLTLIFGIGFPVVLLSLLTLIQQNIPTPLFTIEKLTPGVVIFGLSFVSLFSATLISKDRSEALFLRLYTSPMKASDFILGYTLPLIPMAFLQNIICFVFAIVFGLEISINILVCILVSFFSNIMFVSLGLLFGSILNDKQVGGVCGAILTNVSAWLSGTWFDIGLVGGFFETLANLLPFAHAVNAGRFALLGDYKSVLPELVWVIAYAVVLTVLAIYVFTKKMKSDDI